MPDDLFRVDASDLTHLATRMRHVAEEFRSEMDHTLLEIGGEMVAAARAIAEPNSAKVARTIELHPGSGEVTVRAGDKDTPIAELWEQGNRGSRASATTFRHPVFGRDVWVDQEKKPFLRPARAGLRREITRRMEQAWERALDRSGLRL